MHISRQSRRVNASPESIVSRNPETRVLGHITPQRTDIVRKTGREAALTGREATAGSETCAQLDRTFMQSMISGL